MPDRATVAAAFSRHQFREVEDRLADDVTWTLVGTDVLRGKLAVMQRCAETESELNGVATTWESFRVADARATVVVESWATYAGGEGEPSRVASCDLYDFRDGRIVAITSFTVEA